MFLGLDAITDKHRIMKVIDEAVNFCNGNTWILYKDIKFDFAFNKVAFLVSNNAAEDKNTGTPISNGKIKLILDNSIHLSTTYILPTFSWNSYEKQVAYIPKHLVEKIQHDIKRTHSLKLEFKGGTGICNFKGIELVHTNERSTAKFYNYKQCQQVIKQIACTKCNRETTVLIRRDHLAQCDGNKTFYFTNINFLKEVDRIQFEVASCGRGIRGHVEVALIHRQLPNNRMVIAMIPIEGTGNWQRYTLQAHPVHPKYRQLFQLPNMKVECKLKGAYGIGNFKSLSFIYNAMIDHYQERLLYGEFHDVVVETSE